MGDRNLYVVLGVDPSESELGIRTAFRNLAKQHHPDQAGEQGTAAFREIADAYRVLSDRDRRREYDASVMRSRAVPIPVRRAAFVEPLIPGDDGREWHRDGARRARPGWEAHRGGPKKSELWPLDLVLVLLDCADRDGTR